MPWLTGTTTVIGRVASGLQTVERISQSPAASTRILQVRQLTDLVQTGE
jgi:cyclophilin family peptidyl-prolyl cis-trans isomerase